MQPRASLPEPVFGVEIAAGLVGLEHFKALGVLAVQQGRAKPHSLFKRVDEQRSDLGAQHRDKALQLTIFDDRGAQLGQIIALDVAQL